MRRSDVDLAALATLAEDLFPRARRRSIERTAAGSSTQVYCIRRDDAVYYLRFAEQPGESLAAEARVHALLRERGVRVPEVVYLEHRSATFGRSLMITSEIAGRPVWECADEASVRAIFAEAGRDLAIINSLQVEGFGWIRRNQADVTRLQGQFASHSDWAYENLDADLDGLDGTMLSTSDVRSIRCVVRRCTAWLREDQACLAHGDFDTTHIYEKDCRYSGIIDFGEIRGAEPMYDLAHFRLHHGERLQYSVLPSLLEGYAQIAELPPEFEQRICLSALLIGVRALARSLGRPDDAYQAFLRLAVRRQIAALRV